MEPIMPVLEAIAGITITFYLIAAIYAGLSDSKKK